MRVLKALKNDICYQAKYGFYFLYAFITFIYIILLKAIPTTYKHTVSSIIILSDPAMLGFFFIGGIWLLEKEEGLHSFWSISPLQPIEYISSKIISLGVISTLAALSIIFFGVNSAANILLMTFSVFIGSCIFTLVGLYFASFAETVNHYMVICVPAQVILMLPAFMTAFRLGNPLFNLIPSTSLWNLIYYCISGTGKVFYNLTVLIIWLCFFLLITLSRINLIFKGCRR
ncbi:hypothetical protein CIW83_10610 [Tissierella sp. P1]|uniref:fluoroquinolone export ABC transporter permease subunit n=1 Tax=unclassified Tissierella TaxID=2638726 RepID=UPI000BA01885|nr:hypothetical protein [Tissierella sp. P1]OZV12259.1 hypothetical protein CIW83_10610 [Tissierella sp. P1]